MILLCGALRYTPSIRSLFPHFSGIAPKHQMHMIIKGVIACNLLINTVPHFQIDMPAISYSNVSYLKTMVSDVHLHFSGYQAFVFPKLSTQYELCITFSAVKLFIAGNLKSFN